jgi:hypothetical protein
VYPGQPRITYYIENLIVRLMGENSAGDTVGLLESSATLNTTFLTKRWAASCAVRESPLLPDRAGLPANQKPICRTN